MSPAEPLETPHADTHAHGHAVLVVEDDEALRTEIAELLEFDGYRVLEAPGGKKALEILKGNSHVDVILLDLWMPDMDGWAFRDEQRKDPTLRDIPVVVLSADGSPQARTIDADAFIRKPFDAENLSSTARRVIAEHRTGSQRAAGLVSETVSLLAGAICHEVADPLMTLIARLERIRGKGGWEALHHADGGESAIEEMLDQCWRIAGALRTLRDLPCPAWAREREVDVAQLVRAALAWTGGEQLRFRCEMVNDAIVHGDPLVVVYVCTAVLHNAIEAIPKAQLESDDGQPHMEVRLVHANDEVILEVRDHGPPIPEEDLRRLFSVEYPGRARAWSTGLRLWFVRQAVLGLGGTVEVSNEEPTGVRCRVKLPAARKAVNSNRPPQKGRDSTRPLTEEGRNM